MRVVGARIDLEVAEHGLAERPVGEHAPYRSLEDALGAPLELLLEGAAAEAARIAGVAVVHDLLGLAAGQPDLARVHDDDEVTVVEMRLVGRLVLAAQQRRRLGGYAAERPALGIEDVPVLGDLRSLAANGGGHARYPSSYQTRWRQSPWAAPGGPMSPVSARPRSEENCAGLSEARPTRTSPPTMRRTI